VFTRTTEIKYWGDVLAWEQYNPESYDEQRYGHMAERRQYLIKGMLESSKGTVLDFGCGTGKDVAFFATNFPDLVFYGIDTDEKFIEFARAHFAIRNLSFINNSIFNFKIPLGFIYSIDVLHHVDEMDKVISHIYSILETGAQWLVIEPNILNPKGFLNQLMKKDERMFYQRNTEKIFEKTGFKIVKKGFFLLIPCQCKTPSRFLMRLESRFEGYLGGSVYYLLEK